MNGDKTEVEIELPMDLAERLKKAARQKRCSVEELVVEYLIWYLQTYSEKMPPEGEQSHPLSLKNP